MRFTSEGEEDVFRRLIRKIQVNRARNHQRTLYADGEMLLAHYDARLPDGKTIEQTPFFWPQKAISVFASRLVPARFTMRDEGLLGDLEDAFIASDAALVESMAIRAALEHGPAFVFTSPGDVDAGESEVIVTMASAMRATAEFGRTGIAGTVTAALEMVSPRRGNLHLPGRVLDVELGTSRRSVVHGEYRAPQRVGCAPYIHGPSDHRPFGVSRISRPVMGYTRAAMRAFVGSEVSGAWYAQPRERALGVDAESFADGAWIQAPGGVQGVPDISEEDAPNMPDSLRRAEFHTLPQMSMQPYSDQMRMIGGLFSGAASIPPSYIGIVADSNPQSAQAVWASEIDLVREANLQRPGLNKGRRLLALNVLTVLHGNDFSPRDAAGLVSHWEDPHTRSPLEQSQFVAQQVGVGNMQPGTAATLAELPITPESAQAIREDNRRAGSGRLLDRALEARRSREAVEPVVAGSGVLGVEGG